MLKPACVKCRRFYRPKKNGFPMIEGMPVVNGAEPGLAEPEAWQPYKLYQGDLWECRGCGAEIVVGCGTPIAEHFQPTFEQTVESLGATLQVNDC